MRAAPQVAVQLRGVFEPEDDDQLLGGKSPSARTRSTFAHLQLAPADRNDDALTCEEVVCMDPVQAHATDGAALLQKNA